MVVVLACSLCGGCASLCSPQAGTGTRGLGSPPTATPDLRPPYDFSRFTNDARIAAMFSVHAHAFWPDGDFPDDYRPAPLDDASRFLQADYRADSADPMRASRRRRAIARLAAFGFDGRDIREPFGSALDRFEIDRATIMEALGQLWPVGRRESSTRRPAPATLRRLDRHTSPQSVLEDGQRTWPRRRARGTSWRQRAGRMACYSVIGPARTRRSRASRRQGSRSARRN
jgi:hypothetical protein